VKVRSKKETKIEDLKQKNKKPSVRCSGADMESQHSGGEGRQAGHEFH
jgi:hypothetical protein